MFFVYILNISLTVSTLKCQFFSYNFLKLGEKYQIFEKFGQPHFDCTLYRPWTEIRTCTLCFRKIRYIFINNSQITFRYFVLFSRYKIKNSLENPLKQHLCAAPLGVQPCLEAWLSSAIACYANSSMNLDQLVRGSHSRRHCDKSNKSCYLFIIRL